MPLPNYISFSSKKLKTILQSEASECGLACLAMIANYHGFETNLFELRKRFVITLKGGTLQDLIHMGSTIGFDTRPVRAELSDLNELSTPCILHWDMNHFVVLKNIKKKKFLILDPAVGDIEMPIDSLSQHFTGVALELTPNLEFRRKTALQKINLDLLLHRAIGLKRGLLQLFLLALGLETVALILPIFTQWITDEVIVSEDFDLLNILCGGMLLLTFTSTIIAAFRSWVGLYISTNFSMQWMSNIMTHLLKLPIDYFEQRHIGDIVSRFGSVHAIQNTITGSLVDVVLDGFLALGALVLMFVFNPGLASVSLAAVCVFALLKWIRLNAIRLANQNIIIKQAREQTYFLETIRGVRSIKLFNREAERKSAWLDRFTSVTNATIAIQRINLSFGTGWGVLNGLERTVILFLGARLVISSQLSLGMLLAFIAYKEQFTSKVTALIDKLVDISMLSLQTERLADIVLAKPEETTVENTNFPLDMTLSLERVAFRYGTTEPYILKGIDVTIAPGDFVAITGSSGGGKSTLIKLMLNILTPSLGKVQLGGVPLSKLPLHKYRSIFATVMQDDQLYAGSILENISFFDAKFDLDWVLACAKLAEIDADIKSMPMGYHTLVGDMGAALSGGQKQRILLARALYARPQILFLDEATSHLDARNEALINRAISNLHITRIIVAHRPDTVRMARRVLQLVDGKLIETSDVDKAVFSRDAADSNNARACDTTTVNAGP